MIVAVLNWLKGLSIVGKGILGISTIGVMTSVASQPPQEVVVPNSAPITSVAQPVESTKEITETQAIPFERSDEETSSLPSGSREVKTAGINGVKTVTYKVTYSNNNEVKRELLKEEITTQPVDEVTLVGTYVAPISAPRNPRSDCDPNYAGVCVPLVDYDLDCPDIGFLVQVVGYDKHRFDRDRDGYGCETYR